MLRGVVLDENINTCVFLWQLCFTALSGEQFRCAFLNLLMQKYHQNSPKLALGT